MEELFKMICAHAEHAHWIIFGLILLSGFCLPISEELMLLTAGAIASSCIPHKGISFYPWVYLACCLSGWEAYWLGRLVGPRLLEFPLFRSVVTPRRLKRLQYFYTKYGIFTFLVGRFCPGGVRNALFISSGLTKMPFPLFVLRDSLACLMPTMLFFYLGYRFGENYDQIIHYFKSYEKWFFIVMLLFLTTAGVYLYKRRKP